MRRSLLCVPALAVVTLGCPDVHIGEITETEPQTDGGGSTTGGDSEPTTGAVESSDTSTSGTTSTDTTSGETGTSGATLESSGTTDTSTSNDLPCQFEMMMLQPSHPNIMLVLDKSGSMTSEIGGFWDHDGDPNTPDITRWNSLHQVVASALAEHEASQDFGANLVPSKAAMAAYNESACVVNAAVEVPVAPLNAAAILAAIPAADESNLKGAQATTKGFKAAVAELLSIPGGRPNAIILVSDGLANCQENAPDTYTLFETYDDDLAPTVADAQAQGIDTYVVGIEIADMVSSLAKDGNPDATNPFEKLTEVATAGGQPFRNAFNQGELQTAFDQILADTICVLVLDHEPDFPDLVEVLVQGVKLPFVNSCADGDGWAYTNPNGPYVAIELCGQACDDLASAGEAEVDFFCMG